MEIELKQRLINLVRENECIYNNKHKEYKNNYLKTQLWENIGAALNIEGNEAKQMWRTLRDGYTRHHKQVKWQKGSSRKYTHYMWSADMTFLDAILDSRAIDPDSFKLSPASATSPFLQQTGLANRPILSNSVLKRDSDNNEDSTKLSPTTATSIFQLQPGSPNLHSKKPIVTLPNSAFKRRNSDSSDEILTKKKKEDAVDHLFMSYAETFKRFSTRKQAELKVVLAKMFAEAELSELEDDTSVNKDSAPMAYYPTEESSENGIKKEFFWHSSE
ncbi:hypothetical protein MSG28_004563 [Choristoneura fumiferana]|uniref:Uncharacterized protein n=1 Tax=Choristoneura fumiferana TaxID=7141 RepID=A0ACC0K6P5_CHOFU|nr:hypothetical protein MSG28_004563 [Choristoneura fumiferana]